MRKQELKHVVLTSELLREHGAFDWHVSSFQSFANGTKWSGLWTPETALRLATNDGTFYSGALLGFLETKGLVPHALRNADLPHAYVFKANLRYVDMRGADFQFATFCEVDFLDAKLSGADFRDAKFIDTFVHECADFDHVDFRGAKMCYYVETERKVCSWL